MPARVIASLHLHLSINNPHSIINASIYTVHQQQHLVITASRHRRQIDGKYDRQLASIKGCLKPETITYPRRFLRSTPELSDTIDISPGSTRIE
jgi:hypothetical protein